MKINFKILLAAAGMMIFVAACNKVDDLPTYGNGKASTLTASSLTVAPSASDSLNEVVAFNWTYADYATDSANHKYVLEIDSAGKNFSNPARKVVMGALGTSFIGKEFNDILLSFGFAFNVAYTVEARVVSSYGNNNEQIPSTNTLTMNVTPYKVPPRVQLPTTNRLFLTGGATEFDWTNPSPMPVVRELTRLDETTWGGIFSLSGSSGYLLLREAGNWDDKYSVQDNSLPGAANAGAFGFRLPQDFPGNVAQGAGWYKMIYDFQQGRYTVTKQDNPLSRDLYITGSATASSWINNPPPTQKFTMLSSGVFEITIALQPNLEYKFLNTSGQWQPQFGGSSATGGTLGANYGGGADPAAIPTPAVAGNYKIVVNFITGTYTVTLV
jgi:hypothetical protein